ncbi:hypothetical protein [Paenibacillus sp. IITD108]|uniref:hypothetical protein n=1 Tax=Paenibacillus sp. IITD108 TaxID=3116649 RepID=UPI002F3E3707
MLESTTQKAKGLGLEYRYDNMIWQDTLNTHRVAKYAQEVGKGKEYPERIFMRYLLKINFFRTMSNLSL